MICICTIASLCKFVVMQWKEKVFVALCYTQLRDNLFECYLGIYLELAFVYTEEPGKKRDANCWRREKKSLSTKKRKKERGKKIHRRQTGRNSSFCSIQTHSGDDAILWPLLNTEKRSWYANERIKKKRNERISRISSAVKCTHNDKQEERVHTLTHTHTTPSLIVS